MTTKILILAANPQKTDRLLLEEEQRIIREIRQKSEARPDFEIEISPAVRWGDVQDYLRDFKPQIVHFMGHGEGAEGLVLIDDQLQPQVMTGDRWAELFSLYPVDCVVLNACSTEAQAEEIYTHVNCVVGMRQKMHDQSAREFSEGFYGEIFAGADYERAFKAGKARIGRRRREEILKRYAGDAKSEYDCSGKRRRYGLYEFTVFFICSDFLNYYKCYYNFVRGKPIDEEYSEYLYDSIVSTKIQQKSSISIQGSNQIQVSSQRLTISTNDGKIISLQINKSRGDQKLSSKIEKINEAATEIRLILRQRELNLIRE